MDSNCRLVNSNNVIHAVIYFSVVSNFIYGHNQGSVKVAHFVQMFGAVIVVRIQDVWQHQGFSSSSSSSHSFTGVTAETVFRKMLKL